MERVAIGGDCGKGSVNAQRKKVVPVLGRGAPNPRWWWADFIFRRACPPDWVSDERKEV